MQTDFFENRITVGTAWVEIFNSDTFPDALLPVQSCIEFGFTIGNVNTTADPVATRVWVKGAPNMPWIILDAAPLSRTTNMAALVRFAAQDVRTSGLSTLNAARYGHCTLNMKGIYGLRIEVQRTASSVGSGPVQFWAIAATPNPYAVEYVEQAAFDVTATSVGNSFFLLNTSKCGFVSLGIQNLGPSDTFFYTLAGFGTVPGVELYGRYRIGPPPTSNGDVNEWFYMPISGTGWDNNNALSHIVRAENTTPGVGEWCLFQLNVIAVPEVAVILNFITNPSAIRVFVSYNG